MRKLYILNDGSIVITENMEFSPPVNMESGSPVGIKEVHEVDGLSDDEFQHLLENRPEYTPVKDKKGKLIALQSPQRKLVVGKSEENI